MFEKQYKYNTKKFFDVLIFLKSVNQKNTYSSENQKNTEIDGF